MSLTNVTEIFDNFCAKIRGMCTVQKILGWHCSILTFSYTRHFSSVLILGLILVQTAAALAKDINCVFLFVIDISLGFKIGHFSSIFSWVGFWFRQLCYQIRFLHHLFFLILVHKGFTIRTVLDHDNTNMLLYLEICSYWLKVVIQEEGLIEPVQCALKKLNKSCSYDNDFSENLIT